MDPQPRSVQVTHFSFEKYLKVNITLLRICGLLPLSPNATFCDKALDVLNVLIVLTMINIVVIPNIFTLFTKHPDIDIAMQILPFCVALGGNQIKYIVLVLRRNKVKELIESCQDLWETSHPRGYEILSRYVKRGYVLTMIFLSILTVTATCYNIPPLLYWTTTIQELPSSPGFVVNSTIIYKIARYSQCISNILQAYIIFAVDCTFPVLLIHSCGQFDLIRAMLNDINEMHETIIADVNPNLNLQRLFKSKLNECIVRHQRLLAHYAEIEENFNICSLMQILIGLYTIAIGLFNLSVGAADVSKNASLLMTGISQVLLYNWPSETVLEENDITSTAIYDLPWYTKQSESRTTISLLLTMTQQPIRLTAGKFTVLSMETFATIMTNAISIFTVLNAIK